jgi:hypothetical protein
MERIFILSPASTSGKRAAMLMNERAEFELARRLRSEGAALGEVFSFLSGLYFRGKLAYSQRFGRPPTGIQSAHVITSDAGLRLPDEIISLDRLRAFGRVPIDPLEPRYRKPLRESAEALSQKLSSSSEVVLLGSLATNKYTDVLAEIFRDRLTIPSEFIGRGDMSRGGLMLRAVEANQELDYVALTAVTSRRGARPPKLPPIDRSGRSKTNLSGDPS